MTTGSAQEQVPEPAYDPLDPDQACQVCLTRFTLDEPEADHQCGWEWVQP